MKRVGIRGRWWISAGEYFWLKKGIRSWILFSPPLFGMERGKKKWNFAQL